MRICLESGDCMNRISVFAYNENDKTSPSIAYKGYFDGQEFIPKLGYCNSLEELHEYDYVQLFGDNGCQQHSPKRFNKDLLKSMKRAYAKVYGYEDQMELF